MQNKPNKPQKTLPVTKDKPKKKLFGKALFIMLFSIIGVSIGLFGGLYLTGNMDDLTENLPTLPFFNTDDSEITTTNLALEPFLVNLKPTNNRSYYANITLTLDTDDRYSEDIQETKMPVVRDRIITYLSTHTPDSLTGRDETDENTSFKIELTELLNATLENDPIHDVLITDLIIQ